MCLDRGCKVLCNNTLLRYRQHFPIPTAVDSISRSVVPGSGTVFTVPGPRPLAGLCPGPRIIPHRPPSCVFGEGMTVHGGALLHDVIGQGRHSSASFWRPLTGDDTIAMTRPDWVLFHHSCLISERLQHRLRCRSLPGAAKGPCSLLLHASPPRVTGSFPKRRLTKPSLVSCTASQARIASSRMTPMPLWPGSPTAFQPCPRP